MKPSFSILELIIVILIIGILAISVSIYLPNDRLQVAGDELIKNIKFTQSLALKDDKYQPFPLNDSAIEMNRSKYWFKQWWQIRFFQNSNDEYLVEIFTDLPYHSNNDLFDKKGREPRGEKYWNITYARDPLTGKYMTSECRDNDNNYPPCNKINQNLNLTKKYGIKKIEFENFYNRSPRLVFDNFGNVFLNEGKYAKCPTSYTGDCGDINPLDKNNRMILTKIAKIKLCLDNPCNYNKDRCIQINITPTGYVYSSKCE